MKFRRRRDSGHTYKIRNPCGKQRVERVNRRRRSQVILQPPNPALRPAIPQILHETRNLILANRTVQYGIAFNQRDLDLVNSRQQQSLPFFFGSFFDQEFVIRVLSMNQIRELSIGRELLIFRQDTRVIVHWSSPTLAGMFWYLSVMLRP